MANKKKNEHYSSSSSNKINKWKFANNIQRIKTGNPMYVNWHFLKWDWAHSIGLPLHIKWERWVGSKKKAVECNDRSAKIVKWPYINDFCTFLGGNSVLWLLLPLSMMMTMMIIMMMRLFVSPLLLCFPIACCAVFFFVIWSVSIVILVLHWICRIDFTMRGRDHYSSCYPRRCHIHQTRIVYWPTQSI